MSLPSSDIVLYYVVTLTVSFVLQSKKHRTFVRCFFLTSDYLSSRNVSIQVLSAFEGLTTVFGMGTGGTPQLSSLDSYEDTFAPSKLHRRSFHSLFYAFFKSSLRPISIGPLHTSRYFHSRPIYLVIFKGSYQLSLEKLHLKAGFTLRCFQRLSFPDVATQLYAWRHNWYTIGPSTPVLSY